MKRFRLGLPKQQIYQLKLLFLLIPLTPLALAPAYANPYLIFLYQNVRVSTLKLCTAALAASLSY